MRNTAYIVALAVIWLISLSLVNPLGDFPLNDDWVYSIIVYNLHTYQELVLPEWIGALTLSQIVLSLLYCSFLGFSFTTSKIATLTLSLAGVLGTYALLREIRSSKNFAFLGSLLILFNPFYFSLSASFMTDVPYYAFSVFTLLFYIRAFKTGATKHIVIATVFAVLAMFARQIGLFIGVSFAVAFLFKYKISKVNLLKAILPPLILWALYYIYVKGIESSNVIPDSFYDWPDELKGRLKNFNLWLCGHIIAMTLQASLYISFFFLPLTAFTFLKRWKMAAQRTRLWMVGITGSFCSVCALYLIQKQFLMPIVGNMIYDYGLGPALLRDVYHLKLDYLPRASNTFWVLMTVLSVVGAGLLAESLATLFKKTFFSNQPATKGTSSKDLKTLVIFVSLIACFYFGPMAVVWFLDRYLLCLFPLFLIILKLLLNDQEKETPLRKYYGLSYLILLPVAWFSIAGTHDYLSWNQARWDALNYLTQEEKISPKIIDGGFEFNGWHRDPYKKIAGEVTQSTWSWIVDEHIYVVTFGPLEDHEVIKKFPFDQWLNSNEGKIYIVKKISD